MGEQRYFGKLGVKTMNVIHRVQSVHAYTFSPQIVDIQMSRNLAIFIQEIIQCTTGIRGRVPRAHGGTIEL